MTFAHVTNGVPDAYGRPPDVVQQDGRWYDLRPRDPATLAIVGWYEIVETARPADTATTTHDVTYTFDGDSVNQSWTARPWTADELAARLAQANRETVDSRLVTVDLPAMQAIIDQTNADLRADPSQEIKDIARAVRRLTRIAEGVLDGVD